MDEWVEVWMFGLLLQPLSLLTDLASTSALAALLLCLALKAREDGGIIITTHNKTLSFISFIVAIIDYIIIIIITTTTTTIAISAKLPTYSFLVKDTRKRERYFFPLSNTNRTNGRTGGEEQRHGGSALWGSRRLGKGGDYFRSGWMGSRMNGALLVVCFLFCCGFLCLVNIATLPDTLFSPW
ncbi:hypothetical protein VTJ49DRAFT_7691 [Mycothermus thermophilus]|uniref:Uncharacterized protein n=1 Tax=Humicola insolens TaxID=85995 RepID=A0ABR3VG55_HUMIN